MGEDWFPELKLAKRSPKKGRKCMWIRLKQAVAVALHLAAMTEKPTAEIEAGGVIFNHKNCRAGMAA